MDFKLVDKLPSGMQAPKDEPKLDVGAIPDLEKLLETVLEFLKYISTDEMQKLEDSDPTAFERHLDSKFENLSLRYYSIFKLLLDKEHREENVCKLIDIFTTLNKIKSGSLDIKKATDDFHEEQNHEYIYPKFGGKEEFEKEMLKDKYSKKEKGKNKH